MKPLLLMVLIVGMMFAGEADADVIAHTSEGTMSTTDVAGVRGGTAPGEAFAPDTGATLLWLLLQPAEAGWSWVIRGGYESQRACDADLQRHSPWIPGLYCAGL